MVGSLRLSDESLWLHGLIPLPPAVLGGRLYWGLSELGPSRLGRSFASEPFPPSQGLCCALPNVPFLGDFLLLASG